MRALLAQYAEPAVGVAEHHQVLAQQPDLDRLAVGLRDLFGHAGGNPMPPHQLAHRGVALDAAQQVVVLGRDHRVSSGWRAVAGRIEKLSDLR